MGKKTPQSYQCLGCNAVITLPRRVPDGWWLNLTRAWENPPALTLDVMETISDRPFEEYPVRVKANGYTVKSILPYFCPECRAKLTADAQSLWEEKRRLG